MIFNVILKMIYKTIKNCYNWFIRFKWAEIPTFIIERLGDYGQDRDDYKGYFWATPRNGD